MSPSLGIMSPYLRFPFRLSLSFPIELSHWAWAFPFRLSFELELWAFLFSFPHPYDEWALTPFHSSKRLYAISYVTWTFFCVRHQAWSKTPSAHDYCQYLSSRSSINGWGRGCASKLDQCLWLLIWPTYLFGEGPNQISNQNEWYESIREGKNENEWAAEPEMPVEVGIDERNVERGKNQRIEAKSEDK